MTLTADSLERLKPDSRRLAAARKRAVHGVTIAIGQTACRIAVDNPTTAAGLAARYRHVLTAKAAGQEILAVRERDGRGFFWAERLGAFQWPYRPLDDATFEFLTDAVAMTEFFSSIDGVLSLHAAAVGGDAGCAALIGDSTAGKTTTALACARRGLMLYSDERCVIAEGSVHPFPRAINIRAGGARLLSQDGIDDALGRKLAANGGSDWYAADYASLFESWANPAARPLVAAIVLSGHAAQAAIEPATPGDVMRVALPWVNCTSRGLDRVARVRALFAPIACYRLTLGPPDESAALIEKALARGLRV